MKKSKKNYLEQLSRSAQLLFSCYEPGELEDCLFEVFEEANLYSDLVYEEKEKRKLLHDSLRQMFRTVNKNKKLTQKILNNVLQK